MTGISAAQSPTSAVSELLSSLSRRLDPLIVERFGDRISGDWTTVLAELNRMKG